MPTPSDPRLLVLHGLRLKGFADTEPVAELLQMPAADVAAQLDGLLAEDLVVRRDGTMSGWALTPTGRKEGERLLAEELDAVGGRELVADAYARFTALNDELLALCTDWQMRGEAVNDHSDAAYDQEVIGRLIGFHDRVRPVVVDLRELLERFGGYSSRLRTAVERVAGGEPEYFTRPIIDSYHTVWFELHEDLLATLGLDRATETAGGAS